jgi:hypothetical protein
MDYRNITIAFLVCALPLAQSIVSIVVDASQHNNDRYEAVWRRRRLLALLPRVVPPAIEMMKKSCEL